MSVLKIGLTCDGCDVLFNRRPGESTLDLRRRARNEDKWWVNWMQRFCDPKECEHPLPGQRVDICRACMQINAREAGMKIERAQRARDGFDRIV